jgi:beta-galactosidase/beta-glucuronidase
LLLPAVGLSFGLIQPASLQAQTAWPGAEPIRLEGQRTRLNFNRDWRYRFGDVAGAQAPAFDDAGWEKVGLPHSFSIPYFRSPSFPVGYGWYRKHFILSKLAHGRRLSLEFEGAFQDAEVFVNGTALARHRGGYTGFSVDITDAVREGGNVLAVRVDNLWSPTLAPRAGEHVFSGGLYRDVWLVATDAVHVPWTGTFVTTPELSEASGRVAVETEVHNEDARTVKVTARSELLDPFGRRVMNLPKWSGTVRPGETVTSRQLSAPVPRPLLWSPETPLLYRVRTRLFVNGRQRDRFETPFGFRWLSWTADRGFFLNGKHRYFKGGERPSGPGRMGRCRHQRRDRARRAADEGDRLRLHPRLALSARSPFRRSHRPDRHVVHVRGPLLGHRMVQQRLVGFGLSHRPGPSGRVRRERQAAARRDDPHQPK